MVDAIANLSLEILRDLLVEETKFLRSVKGDVEKVKRDLKRIHGMLKKADKKRSASPTLRDYVVELKDLASEAETVLETYAVKVESKREGSRSLKEKLQRYICIMCEWSTLHEVGVEVRDILSRLSELNDKLQSEFGQQFVPHPGQEKDLLRQTYADEVQPHFVGMKKDIDRLVPMMTMDVNERVIIKIYGMGGLGKTTLARKIYNHADVVAPHARAWVCVTQHFQHKSVLSTILKTLENNEDRNKEIDGKEVDDLKAGIHSFAKQRKCLIVIDDIWENKHWDIIKKALPINCNVLLTTRNQNIANEECIPHKLEFLTEDEGWDLLHKIALPKCPQPELSLEGIGRKIVEKCGGLPLSISVIGGILRQKEEENLEAEWRTVYANMDLYLSKGEGVKENKRVKQVLELSYDALPYYLKPCFLYLAFFPENEELDTERLYLLWMAEGFISHQDKGPNETLRDVAERYLTELGMRCMVEVHKTKAYSPYKKFDSCGLHDLMHELCSSKAQEENLLKRIEKPTPSIGNSISRLAIILDVHAFSIPLLGLEKVKNLRSFMLLTKDRYPSERKMIFEDSRFNFENSRRLRVLLLEDCEFEGEKLPKKVHKLIHLRYLSLRFSCVKGLPEFICCMPYLQTLDLQVSYSVPNSTCGIRVPNVIWKMKKLKHLLLPSKIEVIGGGKLKLDGLNELETLQHVESKKVCIADIPKLISLRKLSVTVDDGDGMSTILQHMRDNKSRSSETILFVELCDLSSEMGKDMFRNILMSPSLVMLHISGCNFSGGFPCYEQGMCSNLVHMELDDCKVGVEMNVMRELGNYPILQSLTLNQVDFAHAKILTCPSNSFPQLDFLILRDLSNIEKWEVEERAMQKLTKLWIDKCINLKKIPNGLKLISTLRKLDISAMPEEFNERVSTRGLDFMIVSHIPSITIE